MDSTRSNTIHELFSRGSTPPPGQQQSQPQPFPSPHAADAPTSNQIDSLFHNIASPPADSQQPTNQNQGPNVYGNSEPATPSLSLSEEPVASSVSSVSNSTAAERQNALLSLLGNPSSNRSNASTASQAQQVPTPPGSSQRSGASPSHNETQGKILLEQLMAGNPPRSSYSDSQRNSLPAAAPSPPYGSSQSQREDEYRQRDNNPYNPLNQPSDITPRAQAAPPPPAQSQSQPPQPPSPSRKSMFEYVSPFDALAQTSSMSVKKKPVPAQPSSVSSVDNLLENLTRGHLPQPPVAQAPPPAYEPYNLLGSSDYATAEPVQPRVTVPPPPLPPKPAGARPPSPPRVSPPKQQLPNRIVSQRPMDSPASQAGVSQLPPQSGRRDKESSPGPRGFRAKGQANRYPNKNQSSPSPQPQTVVYDVSQSLEEIQAPRDSVKSTAIALVRQDAVFLPGTTIGATHWVAYAMTRGRVRVISRSSGDRTLLQLPNLFPTVASVTDMAVYGNRLAGVTSDGGFVIWELPEVITDDVPGELLLCIPPPSDGEAPLHAVKWHPKEPDMLAIASENRIYLINLANFHSLRGQPLQQHELIHLASVFSLSNPLVAFDFDVLHGGIATISEDSTFTLWNMHDRVPYTTHKIRGDDMPSSITFVDGGVVIGRKNGTIFQLLSMATKTVLSTIKFVNGDREDPDMFGHVSYDTRIQTLWVANCRRDSMIAIKLNVDPAAMSGEDVGRGYFEQVVEFTGPKPTIHFVILTMDADPHGDEALAACAAAKVPPGELALVAFSVHASGVDQILIRKEWFDHALLGAPAKFPSYSLPQPPAPASQSLYVEPKGRPIPPQFTPQMSTLPNVAPQSTIIPPARLRTPPSEDVEADLAREEARGADNTRGKGQKGKNVNWKEREENNNNRNGNRSNNAVDSNILNESALGQALTKEIKRTEDNLHTRIGRLIGKEMDKQHQRLEEARVNEQAEDFARQEKILKLISTELTRNTTRVVEMAVKNEVQNSVLPSLENITKTEVKSALNDQIGRGVADFIGQSLPNEIEKLLLRPDISAHFAHLLSSSLTPLLERQVKEAVTKTFLPVYSQQSSSYHQEVLRELRTEMHSLKSEVTAWQNDAFRNQETSIRELEHTVRALSEQVKFLTMNSSSSGPAPMHHLPQVQQNHNSPGPSIQHGPTNMTQQHMRPAAQNMPPPAPQPPTNYGHNNFSPQTQPPAPLHTAWYSNSIAAPQASHPATLPQPNPQPQERTPVTPPVKPEQWDEIYLGVLHTQDTTKLRDLLMHTNPDVIMPLNGPVLVSQAVILTLVHRLSATVGEAPPNDDSFKTSLWWLQRSVALLQPEDKLIADFIPRVLPNVQHSLNTTKQRLTILPGGPATLETARKISDIQDALRRKVTPV
ncbi:Enhancer of mRNA-decapping protein 4 WD40 repeat region domain-containing protein [Pleurotus pulmonarius]